MTRALLLDWQPTGRAHGGLMYVSTTTFPQDRAFLGALVGSLDRAAQAEQLPGSDETCFLPRAS